MLAIYDAQDNAPAAGVDAALNQADLYERLLSRFAWHEVMKAATDHPRVDSAAAAGSRP